MDPVLPRVMVEKPPQPATAMSMVPAGRHSVRPAVLELVDAHGAPFRSRGRGATLESALLIEACFDLEAHATGLSSATLDWTVGGLCKALFPAARGRGGRAETWRRTAEALRRLDGATVPYTQRSGRVDRFKVWSSVLVPGDDAHDTDRVFVTINLPGAVCRQRWTVRLGEVEPGTGPGPILDREAVRRARLASSVAWARVDWRSQLHLDQGNHPFPTAPRPRWSVVVLGLDAPRPTRCSPPTTAGASRLVQATPARSAGSTRHGATRNRW